MDLKSLCAAPQVIDVPLLFDAEGKATDGVKVVGADSKQYQDFERDWQVRSVQRNASRGTSINAATESGAAELVDLMPRREMMICLACVVEIYGFTIDGKPVELNEETLKMLFTARPTWRRKIVNAVEAEQVFIKG